MRCHQLVRRVEKEAGEYVAIAIGRLSTEAAPGLESGPSWIHQKPVVSLRQQLMVPALIDPHSGMPYLSHLQQRN